MNENGELFVELCVTKTVWSLEGFASRIKSCHKLTWVMPTGDTENQIDHRAIGQSGVVSLKKTW